MILKSIFLKFKIRNFFILQKQPKFEFAVNKYNVIFQNNKFSKRNDETFWRKNYIDNVHEILFLVISNININYTNLRTPARWVQIYY